MAWEKTGSSHQYDCDYGEHASTVCWGFMCLHEPGWSCIEM